MDWTGGARRRYATKGKNNIILQKQKAHFAKVHAQKHMQHPFEAPDFLRDAMMASTSHQPVMSCAHHATPRQSVDHHPSEPSESRHQRRHSRAETSSNKRHRMSNEPNETSSAPRSSGRYGNGNNGTDTTHGKAISPGPPRPSPMNDEERLLLANRKRLLARDDWLGLSAARPLRMKFPATSDKENVGKRRKVRQSKDQKTKPARPRSHTPLFRQELRPRHDTRSNAGPDVDMRIKIGTDAFATQTQTSRHSQAPANTSMRQPSTEFGSISEESMLLGVDGDGFELKTDGAAPLENIREPDPKLQTDFTCPSYDFAAPTVSMAPSFQLSQDSEPVSTLMYRDREPARVAPLHSSHHKAADLHHHLGHDDAFLERADDFDGGESQTLDACAAERISQQMGSEDDDDETFRTLMKADATLSGKSSMAAMASSSHDASTQSAQLANLQPQSAMKEPCFPDHDVYRQDHDVLMPRSDSLVVQPARTTKSDQYGPTEPDSSIACGSPSTSLRQLYRTISRPTEVPQMPPDPPDEDDDDDEALWRSIILPSRGSDSAASDLADTVQKTWVRNSDDIIEPAAYSSSPKAITEKVQSDKATFGGSGLAGLRGSNYESRRDEYAESESSQHLTNTSMLGNATTVPLETDDIDDADDGDDDEHHPRSHSFTTGNIHAASKMSANYCKRFKDRKQSIGPPLKVPPRFEASRARRARQETSTYVH